MTDPEHDCDTCTDCIHNGNRCCGCYDGDCCRVRAAVERAERARNSLKWFFVRSERELMDGFTMHPQIAPGYDRVLDLARDVAARPHDPTAGDRLDLECREMACNMVEIAHKDGNANSLANVFRAMLIEAVTRHG